LWTDARIVKEGSGRGDTGEVAGVAATLAPEAATVAAGGVLAIAAGGVLVVVSAPTLAMAEGTFATFGGGAPAAG
jgi:hypothetical protein